MLIRLLVPQNENSRDRIILATNNQTIIPAVALRSTDSIHRQIEIYFKARGLYYDRRKNYYKNIGKQAREIVSIGFLGQCLMSLFMGKPNYARARPSTVLSDDENYKKLYEKFPDLKEKIDKLKKENKDAELVVVLTGSPGYEELAELLTEDGQELSFKDIVINSVDSVDGFEHPINSFDEWRKYYRVHEVEGIKSSPIIPRE